ncbi:hypothetical protein CEQ21_25640 [Niallia circulans]|uniref:Uncharacterized protein n=1 Tax=Niallia circulans TaxID=1397 RepID=A0A553SP45_NIACI|nr:hypothetical protein CEQ21_25640 [Niallia circulans]
MDSLAYDLEPMAPAAGQKSGRRLLIGDKHKTRWPRRGALSPSWTAWLMTSSRWRLQLDRKAEGDCLSATSIRQGGREGAPFPLTNRCPIFFIWTIASSSKIKVPKTSQTTQKSPLKP